MHGFQKGIIASPHDISKQFWNSRGQGPPARRRELFFGGTKAARRYNALFSPCCGKPFY